MINKDGSVKSPFSALRFIPRYSDVLTSTPHSSGFARLETGAFYETVPNSAFYKFINKEGRANRGFTLFELLVVLLIMGLVSSLVAVNLSGTVSHMNVQTAARKIASSLRFARSQATTEQIVYIAAFDFENRRFSILRKARQVQEQEESQTSTAAEKAPDNPREYILPEGVAFSKFDIGEDSYTDGKREIRFFPNGSSSGGRLWLEGEKERQYMVDIDFITGAVKITGTPEK